MPRDGVEVAVDMEHGRIRSKCSCRDQTVGGSPKLLAGIVARAADRPRVFETR